MGALDGPSHDNWDDVVMHELYWECICIEVCRFDKPENSDFLSFVHSRAQYSVIVKQ